MMLSDRDLLRGAVVLVDDPAEDLATLDPVLGHVDGFKPGSRRRMAQGPVRTSPIVMINLSAEDSPAMAFAENQEPVQTFSACAAHPSLADGVDPRRADRGLDDPQPFTAEHLIEGARKLRVSIAKHELQAVYSSAQVHEEIPGLLRHPLPGRMAGDTGKMNPAVEVLDEDQHIQSGSEHRIDVEEVGGDDARGLGGEKLFPGRARASRCGARAISMSFVWGDVT
jgi:hypothetical protein